MRVLDANADDLIKQGRAAQKRLKEAKMRGQKGDPADRALRNKLRKGRRRFNTAQSAEGPKEEPAAGDESDEPAADAAGSAQLAP